MTRLPFSDPANVGVIEDGVEGIVPLRELRSRLHVDGLIRLHAEDFSLLGQGRDRLVHFNLGFTSNQVGKRYAIVPIVKAGRRCPDGTEILPVVNPSMARRGVCTEIIQHLPLEDVTAAQFADSLPNIRSPAELGAALLRRYLHMFPDRSATELLDRGCTLTRIAFLN